MLLKWDLKLKNGNWTWSKTLYWDLGITHSSPLLKRIPLIALDAYSTSVLAPRRAADNHMSPSMLLHSLPSGEIQFSSKDKRGFLKVFEFCILKSKKKYSTFHQQTEKNWGTKHRPDFWNLQWNTRSRKGHLLQEILSTKQRILKVKYFKPLTSNYQQSHHYTEIPSLSHENLVHDHS